jgi:hypothetical protein
MDMIKDFIYLKHVLDTKSKTLPLEMIHQDSNKFSNSTLVSWLFAEEADNEVFVVFSMEHYKLVLSIGDTQPSQLQRDNTWTTIRVIFKRINLKTYFAMVL